MIFLGKQIHLYLWKTKEPDFSSKSSIKEVTKHQESSSKLFVVQEAWPIWWCKAGVWDTLSVLLMVSFGWVLKNQTSTQISFGSRNYCVGRHTGILCVHQGHCSKPVSHRADPMPFLYLPLPAWAPSTLRGFSTLCPVLLHSYSLYNVEPG